jgi:hypothetical protein
MEAHRASYNSGMLQGLCHISKRQHAAHVGGNKLFERQFIMDKILKAADDIAAVFNVTQEWLEPGRSAVVKILKQLVEEKFTSTNNARDEICPHYRDIGGIPSDHACQKYFSCAVNGKLSPVA